MHNQKSTHSHHTGLQPCNNKINWMRRSQIWELTCWSLTLTLTPAKEWQRETETEALIVLSLGFPIDELLPVVTNPATLTVTAAASLQVGGACSGHLSSPMLASSSSPAASAAGFRGELPREHLPGSVSATRLSGDGHGRRLRRDMRRAAALRSVRLEVGGSGFSGWRHWVVGREWREIGDPCAPARRCAGGDNFSGRAWIWSARVVEAGAREAEGAETRRRRLCGVTGAEAGNEWIARC